MSTRADELRAELLRREIARRQGLATMETQQSNLEGTLQAMRAVPPETSPMEDPDLARAYRGQVQQQVDTLQARRDLGLGNLSLLDKVKSAGAAALGMGVRTAAAPLTGLGAAGDVTFLDEEGYRQLVNATPEEQRLSGLSRSLKWLTQAGMFIGGNTQLKMWMLKNNESVNQAAAAVSLEPAQAINDFMSRVEKLEREKVVPGFWTQDLPAAASTTAVIGAASLAAGVASGGAVPPWVVAGFMGASLGADEGINDALEHGATQSQARIAAAVGTLLGTTEALPITRVLDRIDNSTGGIISRKLNEVFVQKAVGNVLKEGLKGAFEEGLQEVAQQVGMDTVAALTYDPERGFTDRWAQAAAAGGGSGFVLSALSAALGLRIRHGQIETKRDATLMREYERVIGEAPDASIEQAIRRDAEFSPLTPAYREIQAKKVEIIEAMEQVITDGRANQTLTLDEIKENLQINKLPSEPDFVPGVDWIRGKDLESKLQTDLDNLRINRTVEPDLKADGVPDALEVQPVVVAGFDTYNKLIEQGQAEIEQWKNNPKLGKGADWLIKTREQDIAEWRDKARQELAFAKDAKNIIAGIRAKFFSPNTKIVLSSMDAPRGMESNTTGDLMTASNGELVHIRINLPVLFGAALEKHPIAKAKETLLHELGHALVNQNFINLQAKVHATLLTERVALERLAKSSKVEQLYWSKVREHQVAAGGGAIDPTNPAAVAPPKTAASSSEMTLYKGVMQEYLTWVSQRMSDPFLSRFLTISPPLAVAKADANIYDARWDESDNPGYWYSFDEFMAENFARIGTQKPFITEQVANFFTEHRKLLEEAYAPYADQAMLPGFEKWVEHMSLEGKLKEVISELSKKAITRYSFLRNPAKAAELGLDPKFFTFDEDLDRFSRWHSWGKDIIQLARSNEHIEPLQRYVRFLQMMNTRVGKFRWRGHNTLREWRANGTTQTRLIGEALTEESLSSKVWTEEDFVKFGIKEDGLKAIAQIKDDFSKVMDRMEQVLLDQVRMDFAHDPLLLEQELKRVGAEITQMREAPFFPLVRFGRYTIQVRAKEDGDGYKKGQLVEFQTFERGKQRDRGMANVRAEYPESKFTIGRGYLTDSYMALQAMPGPVIRALRKKLAERGQLNEEMTQAMDELAKESLPIESVRNHFKKRKGVKGYSLDYMRSYAHYITQMSTHLARIELQNELYTAVDNTKRDSQEIARKGGDPTGSGNGTKRGQIAQMMQDHLQYVLNPGNDWPMLRSIGFAVHLGANLKSALVNATQLLTGTYPYLSARFGDAATLRALNHAIALQARYYAGGTMPDDVMRMIEKGRESGILEQSLATELAVARSTKSLYQGIPVSSPARIWTKFSEILAWPFSTVEKMNRNLTGIAAFQLYKAAGMTEQEAAAMALDTVQNTNHNYERWARAKFMTGKVGANVFLFKNYLQKQLFLALGDTPESNRVLFSMLILSGMMGLPFAEDLGDLFDIVATKLKRALGWNSPRVQSRQFIREMLMEMQMNPDLFMYGLSESSMGLGYLGDVMGWPIPEVDVQGSMSMGNIVPGTAALKKLMLENDPNRAFLDGMGELAGAEASYMASVAQSLLQDNPDTWKRWETALPTALKSLSRAGRYANKDAEFDARGQPIAQFDDQSVQDRLEIAAQAFGFTPSRVSRGWEAYMAEKEKATYYEVWKRSVLRQFNYSTLYEDAEDKESALKAVLDYNNSVPFPEMRISGETLQSSLTNFARSRAEAGLSLPPTRSTIRLGREIRDLYDEGPGN